MINAAEMDDVFAGAEFGEQAGAGEILMICSVQLRGKAIAGRENFTA